MTNEKSKHEMQDTEHLTGTAQKAATLPPGA